MFQDGLGTVFCSKCILGDRCLGCGTIAEQYRSPAERLRDGRVRCGHCAGEAVDAPSDLKSIVPQVRDFYTRIGVSLPNRAKVVLVEPHEITGHAGAGALGMTRMSTNRSSTTVTNVQITWGLPRLLFGRVLAHEIGHGFLAGCKSARRSERETEGICELISSWWLKTCDGPYSRNLERNLAENPSPEYGGGYRDAAAQTAGRAVGEVVDRLRRAGALR
jgi:hypothetical protein